LTVTLTGGFIAGRASADQPQMSAALASLREAKEHLQAATTDKGGHRTRAIEFVDKAIAQVEEGMRFDRRH
jgi:hypothetical protein